MLPEADKVNPALQIIEFGITAIALASSFAWPKLCAGPFAHVERAFARLARRRRMAVIAVGLSVIMLRLAILPFYPVPLPFVPDDFSFLLAAETFAHGRLTNPTPALWTHFESIHISMTPTYQSMYFPGQGLLLAAGQVLFGSPWVAILITSALMCAALTWMLQAWLPANWALLGGFIAVLRLGVFSYWTNTYHSAASLDALCGALVLGSLPRLIKTAHLRYWLLMGFGVAVMSITRPFECMLLCLPVAAVLGRWAWKGKNRPPVRLLVRRAAIPVALMVATMAWLGYYDWKAFGKATTLPYTVNRSQYAVAPYFIWQHPRPEPHYRYAEMQGFYQRETKFFNYIHSLRGFVPYSLEKVLFLVLFYAGFLLILPMLMVRRVLLDRRIRFLVLCVCVLAAGMSIEIFLLPYYVAPFTAAFYAIGLQAMRHLRVWKPEGKQVGLTMVRLLVFSCVALAGLRLFAAPLHLAPPALPASNWFLTWAGPEHFGAERAAIEKQLEQLPGGQLAIVRYSGKHDPLDEWVYNAADIDASKVVWAREMNAADNLELMQYYRHRKVWLVQPDAVPARISPYPVTEMKAGN